MSYQKVEIGDTGTQLVDKTHSNMSDLFSAHLKKPAGEPWFIMITGQSNAAGVHTAATPMIANPKIRDYRESATAAADHAWRVFDPNMTTTWPGSGVLTGLRAGGRGNIAWGLADGLVALTGRDAYIFSVAEGGVALEEWNTGGRLSNEIVAHFSTAMASMNAATGSSIIEPDVIIWHQGESNLSLTGNSSSYATGHKDMRVQAIANGWATDNTTWLIGTLTKTTFSNSAMEGIPYTHQDITLGHDLRVLPMYDLPVNADMIHYEGDSYNKAGRRGAGILLSPSITYNPVMGNSIFSFVNEAGNFVDDNSGSLIFIGGIGNSVEGGTVFGTVDVFLRDPASDTHWWRAQGNFYFQTKNTGGLQHVRSGIDLATSAGTAGYSMSITPFGGVAGLIGLNKPDAREIKWTSKVDSIYQVAID